MKITSKRKVNRYMSFFRNNFGFRVPYQVLIDGTFCLTALEGQVRVAEQLTKYFQSELKLLTTQCVILEMEKIGPSISGALRICKQFAVHKCGHEKKSVPASVCLESMLGHNNPDRYIVATQDPTMREVARKIPGTPTLYLHYRSPTLEKPSIESTSLAEHQTKMGTEDCAMERLRLLKKKELGVTTKDRPFKKKKPKGPNPLSCKKKKKNPAKSSNTSTENANQTQPRKKRKRIRIPKHVRQEMALQVGSTSSS